MKITSSRRTLAAATLTCLGLVLAACGSTDSADSGSDTVTLGYTATLTGDFASYGLEMRQGVDLAVSEINADGGVDGKKLAVDSQDDEGKPANGPVVAQKFCDDDSVSAVLGYSFSSVALSAVPVYQQCTLPTLASAVTSPELSGASPYFFRNVFTDAFQGAAMGTHVHDEGIDTIAVLYQQDDYGQGVSKAFTQAFEAAGGTVTSSQAYQQGVVDFGTAVGKALKDSPDGIFVGGFYSETAKIAKQVRAEGSATRLFATDGAVSPELTKLGGSAIEGMEFYSAFSASAGTPDSAAFVQAFTAKYETAPSSWAALAYDATKTVVAAMKSAGSTDREAVAKALATVTSTGATGEISFDKDGNRKGSLIFLEVKDGDFVAADPAS